MNPFRSLDGLKVSESVRRRNPELFGPGAVCPPVVQPHGGGALERKGAPQGPGRGRVARGGPVLRVALISCRRRIVTDGDNFRTGYKELRDCIARWFGLDDEDGTIVWEYGQHETRGRQETIVRIETL